MYYTPGWAMLATSAVGIVGVGGTLASAWMTQHKTDKRSEKDQEHQSVRFQSARRDRHYEQQRHAIAELIALATRVATNSRLIASAVESGEVGVSQDTAESLDEVAKNLRDKPAQLARVRLIIGEEGVLTGVSEVDKSIENLRSSMGSPGMSGISETESSQWIAGVRQRADDVNDRCDDLVSIARQKFWSEAP
ncbi:hypothetical protein ACWF99_21045 [Nocardia sp. NPDC055002]